MGVPAFFRWLSIRYPKTVIPALSEDELEYLYAEYEAESHDDPNEINLDGNDDLNDDERTIFARRKIQEKIKENNPEFDNLYLDMNGIIHPCTRAEGPGQTEPSTVEDMFNNVFAYVDKVMKIVRPQRLLYMAIDGVAPRAKMNQQRSRRFRGALEAEEHEARQREIHNYYEKEGIKFTDSTLGRDHEKFDKNVITPGTEFMYKLSKSLQHYVVERLHNHPLWKGLKVIFSDASVPGEGEHKILDFIRSQRSQPGYDANTRHCIYGADADLIMLGLSTHEPHFCVIREAFIHDNDKFCEKCKERGHLINDCPTLKKSKVDPTKVQITKAVSFQFIKLNVVREYLYLEFNDVKLPFPFDFERIIDDFVFFCFFVGNDFLPHSPSLHIREGAIDAIMAIYKHQLPALGDYLTCNGKIDFNRVDLIFNDIAKIEEELIKSKKQYDDQQKAREARGETRGNFNRNQQQPSKSVKIDPAPTTDQEKPAITEPQQPQQVLSESPEDKKRKIVQELQEKKGEVTEEELNQLAAQRMKEIVKELLDQKSKKIAEKYVDKVKLGEEGWKLRYYQNKFHVGQEDMAEFLKMIKRYYLEGLQWVYTYYYKGCVSWSWYYPFHYAPFAGDLIGISDLDINFELGEPASPFEQLLGVFPKQSSHAVPLCYRYLLEDPNSEIIDFYPTNFHIDLNGSSAVWMGVPLLPFIDRRRLLRAMKKADRNGEALTPHEKELNRFGDVFLFFEHEEEPKGGLHQAITQIQVTTKGAGKSGDAIQLFASFNRSDEISGTVKVVHEKLSIGRQVKAPYSRLKLENLDRNQVYQMIFEHTQYELHLSKLLQELKHPDRMVEDFEINHINRRFFGGERTIKMLEEKLGFQSNLSAINRSGPYGYQNNRGTTYDGVYQQRNYQNQGGAGDGGLQSNLGKRDNRGYQNKYDQRDQQNTHHRSRQDQQQGNYPRNEYGGNRGGYDRRQQNWGGYDNPNNYSYQQQNYGGYQQNYNQQHHYQQPNYQHQQQPINYNLHQHQQPSQHQQQPHQQQYPPQHQQPPADTVLYQPQPNQAAANLKNLIGQLNQTSQGQRPPQGNQNNQQQQPQNRFHGFMNNNNR